MLKFIFTLLLGISMLNSTPIHAEGTAERTLNEPKSIKRFKYLNIILKAAGEYRIE